MSEAVRDIIKRIQKLPQDDRRVLNEQLAELAEAEWKVEVGEARRIAKEKGIDQAAIDRAVDLVRSEQVARGNVKSVRGRFRHLNSGGTTRLLLDRHEEASREN